MVIVGNSSFKSCYDLMYVYIVVYIVVSEVKLIGRNSSQGTKTESGNGRIWLICLNCDIRIVTNLIKQPIVQWKQVNFRFKLGRRSAGALPQWRSIDWGPIQANQRVTRIAGGVSRVTGVRILGVAVATDQDRSPRVAIRVQDSETLSLTRRACCHAWNQDSRGITEVIRPGICGNNITSNLVHRSTFCLPKH